MSERSQSFSALIGVLYALGLSHRSVEKVLRLFGYRVGYTSSWRDVQKLGSWDTRVGTMELRIPKLRDGSYFPSLLEPRCRSEKALLAVIQQAYV